MKQKKINALYKLIVERKREEAIELLEDLAKTNPDSDVYYYLSFAYLVTAQMNKALETIEKSIALNPTIKAHFLKAHLLKFFGKYDEAINTLLPYASNAEVALCIGHIYKHDKRDFKTALSWYEKAFENNLQLDYGDLEVLLSNLYELPAKIKEDKDEKNNNC